MESSSEEEGQYFDTREDITSVSDSGSDSTESLESENGIGDSLPRPFGYGIWMKKPISISERRNKFLKFMGLSVDITVKEDHGNTSSHEIEVGTDRITDNSGTVLASSSFDDGSSSRQSSITNSRDSLDVVLEGRFVCKIKNLDNGTEFIVDELGEDGMFGTLRELGSNQILTIDEFERNLGLSPQIQQAMQRELQETVCSSVAAREQKGWLKRLGIGACIVHRQVEDAGVISTAFCRISRVTAKMVKVHSHRKRLKEFSALYIGQDIKAHDGSILTMKFSPDGQYLASGGEDGIVRMWQIVESERSEDFDVNNMDPSFVYFAVNSLSEIAPLRVDKDKKGTLKTVRKRSDATCVVFPYKAFKIIERPIHEFHGHCGEVLDLSWSKNRHILSSSVDKTVRLWQVGYDQCLKVFSHSDYVTCVQFNPMDDNYFISGSIDGKVRIWDIAGCRVIDWTDVHEIVTAVCYQLDGKGAVVGSISGDCRFYNASDYRLQLSTRASFQGKKKSPSKRITGFQFFPSDPSKLMVTSADSQVRILCGVNVICRFKGVHNSGRQISASFTSNGTHVISADEDSNIYIWNYVGQNAKSNWSYEHFVSNKSSIALTWSGTTYRNSLFSTISNKVESSRDNMPFLGVNGMFLESWSKGSATWPEEKLPDSTNAWGMVIVTAGWDGRIRSFQNFGLPVRF